MQTTEILLTIKLQQQLFVDPKRINLLKAIQQCGSINQAAKIAGVSYKSAWDHLEAMNNISPKPLLERNAGGKNGGGTALTLYAERLLQLYDLLAQTQEKAFHILQDENIPLDSLLTATAKFAPQSSARNQFVGKVAGLRTENVHCYVDIDVADFPQNLTACITPSSAERLKLQAGKEVMLMVKAPWITLFHQQQAALANHFQAEITNVIEKENFKEVSLLIGKTQCYATTQLDHLQTGKSIWAAIEPEQIVLVTL